MNHAVQCACVRVQARMCMCICFCMCICLCICTCMCMRMRMRMQTCAVRCVCVLRECDCVFACLCGCVGVNDCELVYSRPLGSIEHIRHDYTLVFHPYHSLLKLCTSAHPPLQISAPAHTRLLHIPCIHNSETQKACRERGAATRTHNETWPGTAPKKC